MVKIVHPYRVKSFRKAVSAVMDDLGMDSKIIENLNLIVKVDEQSVLEDASSRIEGVILVDRFS